jgi:Protein of unknown function (DUF2877)
MTDAPGSGTGTAAASVLLHDLLAGPVRPATVLAAAPAATYLEAGGQVLAIVAAGGVRLPCAAMLAAGGRLPAARSRLAVGRGAVHEDGRRLVAIRRWFDPRVRLAGVDRAAVARLAHVVRSRGGVDALLPDDAPDRLAAGLSSGAAGAAGAVSVLLGRGTGLTPAGDDLVAGALATLRALGSPAADALGAAARALAPAATTRLSAALLEAADVGGLVPEAAGVLRALAGGGDVETAAERLVDLGHTSGWHLAAGLLLGVTHAGAGPPDRAPAVAGDGFRRLGTPVRRLGTPVRGVGAPARGLRPSERGLRAPARNGGHAGVAS